MKKIIILLIICLSTLFAQSQDQSYSYTDKNTFLSPNASSLGLFGTIPVSLQNGTTNISLPVYEITDGPIKVPITLNYHSSGFRPDTHPGIVGSNWALNSGGVITRIVKGLPDDYNVDNIVDIFSGPYLEDGFELQWDQGMMYHPDLLTNWTSTSHITDLATKGRGTIPRPPSVYDFYKDSEPDEYDFNFNGYSGKFVFDATSGKMKVLSDPSIKVEYDFTSFPGEDGSTHYDETDTIVNYNRTPTDTGLGNIAWSDEGYIYPDELDNTTVFEKKIKGFKITTPDGFVYKFGFYGKLFSRQELTNRPIDMSTDFFSQTYAYGSIDSWYLTEIDSPDEKNKVSFVYDQLPAGLWSPVLSFTQVLSMDNFHANGYSQKEISDQYKGKFIFPAYLTKIITTNEELDFNYSKSVELTYDYVGILNSLNQQELSYSQTLMNYFNYRAFYLKHYTIPPNPQHEGTPCDLDLWCEPLDFTKINWLELDGITVKNTRTNESSIQWNFQYSHDNTKRLTLNSAAKSDMAGNNRQAYSFHYNNSEPLPPYCSLETDHWGFYNHKSLSKAFASFTTTDFENYYSYKEPDTAYLKTGMLDKITYPTGGYTTFQYEPHQYTQKVLRDASTGEFSLSSAFDPLFAGGLRIKQINNYDVGNQLLSSKKYEYTGGILSGDSQYYTAGYTGNVIWSNNTQSSYTDDHFLSQSILPVSSSTTGSHIGYSKVKEIDQGNGYTEYYYTNYDILDDNFLVSIDPQKSLYYPFASRESERGILTKKIIYNESGVPLRSETYTYPSIPNTDDCIKAVYTRQSPITVNGETGLRIEGAAYKIYNYPYKAVQYASVDNPNSSQAITETHTYTYEPQYNYLQEDRMTNSKGEQVATQYHYAFDLISPLTSDDNGPLGGLIKANMLNQPIETLNILNKNSTDYVKSAKIVTYRAVNKFTDNLGFISDFYAPANQYILNATTPLTLTSVSGAGITDSDGDGSVAYFNPGSTKYAPAKAYLTNFNGDNIEQLAMDSHMQLQTVYDYDMHGNLSQILTPGYNNKTQRKSYIWGYQDCYPIAQLINATPIVASTGYGEALYEPFEVAGDGTLWGTAVVYDHSKHYTGNFSAKLTNSTTAEVNASRAMVHLTGEITKLKLSGWIFSDGPSASIGMNFIDYNNVNHLEKVTTSTSGKWTYVEKDIDVPSSYANYNLMLFNAGNGNVWFDDIRVVPANASMTTYTYEPGLGMTSTADATGHTTTYEYDNLQRLVNIKDQNGNIKTSYAYNYANGTVDLDPEVGIYVRAEITNIQTTGSGDETGGSYYQTGDVCIKMYSDPACTIPLALPYDLPVVLSEGDDILDDMGGDIPEPYFNTYTIAAGSNSYCLGEMDLDDISETYDENGYMHFTEYVYNYDITPGSTVYGSEATVRP